MSVDPEELRKNVANALNGSGKHVPPNGGDGGEVWPDPTNILEGLAAPSFEASCLPQELAHYPALYAHATGFDPTITLTAAVSAAAAALSDDFRICADSGANWFESARLWLLTIAHPGAGKTPGQREMMLPLRELHTELVREYEKAFAEWQRIAKQADDATEAGPEPPRPRIVVNDATIEKLVDVLRENPRGVLYVAEEFDSWLGSLDQYRKSEIARDRGQWLSAFDGGPHIVERVTRGPMFVPNWSIGILSATTPAGLARVTRHLPIDGLLQRFIPVIARRKQPPRKAERALLEQGRESYRETIRRLWAARPRAHNGVVQLSSEAHERFDEWLRETQQLQEGLGAIEPALEAHVAKYAAFALRLALTFHAVQIVSHEHTEARDPAAFPISAATLQCTFGFLKRASQHAMAVYLNRKGASHAYELAQAVGRFVLARTAEENFAGLARRDVIRRVSAYRDADERTQARAIDLLVDMGWLREAEGAYRKAAPTQFAVNPTLAVKYAGMAKQERERRALVRERITEAARDRRESAPE